MAYNSLTSENRINGMPKQRRLLTPVFLKMNKYCACTEDGFKRLSEAHNSLHLSETREHCSSPTLTASHLLCLLIYPSYPMFLCPSPSLMPPLITTQTYNYY